MRLKQETRHSFFLLRAIREICGLVVLFLRNQ
jgi:hypothetical protein